MRILAVFSIFFFGFGAVLIAQPPGGGGRGGQGGGPQFDRTQMQQGGGGPQQRMQGGPPGMQGGQQPPWMQNAAPGGPPGGGPAGRGGQPNAMPGNQPARPGQSVAGQANPDQVTRTMARLRAMDANGNGMLEANEIPANQQDRVNMMVTQLGGNPGNQINLANLERRAMAAAASNAQPNQQQQRGENTREQRQQPVDPLVLPFGETIAAVAPALGFGQRERVVQTSQTNTPQANARGGRQQGDAANQQASVPLPTTVKVSTPYDNIPAALRNNQEFKWFFDFDTDVNGQLSMLEYVNGCGGIWTAGIASEFVGYESTGKDGEPIWVSGLDRNGDGFSTMDEALMTVKERTELRVQEEQAAAGQQGQQRQQVQGPPGRPPATAASVAPMNPRMQAGNAAAASNQGRQPPTGMSNQGYTPGGGRMQGNSQQPMGRGGNRGGRGG